MSNEEFVQSSGFRGQNLPYLKRKFAFVDWFTTIPLPYQGLLVTKAFWHPVGESNPCCLTENQES